LSLFGRGYNDPSEVKYLFVDGGALRGKLKNVSEKLFGGIEFKVDFQKLGHGYTKTFYYDAIPV
jgi:hypothetical protein